ncbi:2-hydroxychromene-2-carboxylate isomerase [Noviherbaspirillum cavernae]|uniref:2-hydroxychromene-2-carboxylate isomerase n=1 Tax=Noviherbaspirillum cavernae TaxID=2320862 RepID=A0A418X4U8_9BURK|nr:2-hydroxychromene-2-carboxylate isomerase [Noviherbaspirillum cavernae]RJG07513.1 2-hydroxychromene-2-carboxylate isomerase [Noviherbaspirillum cavernae]
MTRPIDFYFDFASPYGYFASTRIDALAAKYGRTVEWHPVLLGVVFKTTGAAPLPMVPIKGPYSLHDFERTARWHDIPYKFPDPFPLATQLAARAMLWVQQTHGADKAVAFAKAVYRAYFVDGRNIMLPETLTAVAEAFDIDAAAMLAGANDEATKGRMKLDMETAMARGVFGSPFVIVDDEPFWGFDRFEQIETWLKNGNI